jgi:transcriptional regulator with XRE-family HTH domain
MSYSLRLRFARLRHDMTQEQAAEKLGIDKQTLSNWERGKNTPSPHLRHRIETVYGEPIFSAPPQAEGAASPRANVLDQYPEVRRWVYHFLAELAEAGAPQSELAAAHTLLTSDGVLEYASAAAGARGDPQVVLDRVRAVAEAARARAFERTPTGE